MKWIIICTNAKKWFKNFDQKLYRPKTFFVSNFLHGHSSLEFEIKIWLWRRIGSQNQSHLTIVIKLHDLLATFEILILGITTFFLNFSESMNENNFKFTKLIAVFLLTRGVRVVRTRQLIMIGNSKRNNWQFKQLRRLENKKVSIDIYYMTFQKSFFDFFDTTWWQHNF